MFVATIIASYCVLSLFIKSIDKIIKFVNAMHILFEFIAIFNYIYGYDEWLLTNFIVYYGAGLYLSPFIIILLLCLIENVSSIKLHFKIANFNG
jgi:hypothetical protein